MRQLHEKEGGRSRVVLVERSGEQAVLKWVEAAASERCRQELARERGFYRRFGGLRCVPSPLDEIDAPGLGAGLVLTHHVGTTLRQWLLDHRRVPADPLPVERCAKALGAALRELFQAAVPEAPDREAERRRLGRVFTVLMKSGPLQAPVDGEELAANTRLRGWAAPLARRALSRALSGIPSSPCIAHGDLHPNNVLITPDVRALVLDFGCWEPGECISDLGYLTATLETALADRPADRELFSAELARTVAALGLPGSPFRRVVEVLELGASVNSRLRHDGARAPARARLALLPRLALAAVRPPPGS